MVMISGTGVYWLTSSALTQSKQTTADVFAKGVVLSLSAKLDIFNKILDNMAADPEIAYAISSHNPDLIAPVTAKLERNFPNIQKIRLLLPGVNELDKNGSPQMSLADLDMVRRTFDSDQLPAIQGETIADRHLALTRRIMHDNKPIGVILASLKYDFITNTLKSALSKDSYLELKQNKLVLAASGTKNNPDNIISSQLKVAETGWELVYETIDSGMENSPTIAGIIGIPLIIILGGFFSGYKKLSVMLMHDLSSTMSAFRDMMKNKPQGSYPMELSEFNIIVSSLAQIKRLQSNSTRAITTENKDDKDDKDDFTITDALWGDTNLDIKKPTVHEESTEGQEEGHQPPNILEEYIINNGDEIAAIFKAYDIRGIVGSPLSRDVVCNIGRALGTDAIGHGCKTIVIGRDGRKSSRGLSESLEQGIVSTGCNVLDIGMAPTPLLYFVAHHIEGRSGVMVTGSHNPPQYNGFKMVIKGETLAGDRIQNIKHCIDKQAFTTNTPGTIERNDRFANEYIGTISEDIHIARPMKIVLDCGNGVAGELGPTLLRTLGCEVIELFCDIDGTFPNHHPDPSKPENLSDLITAVKHHEADLGIAFDGDGDRLGVVDSNGKIIWPDRQMMLFAKDVLAGKPGAEIIYDVKCSRHLAEEITRYGGRPLMWKTGHSLMKAKLKETGAKLAGEMSGHIFFNDRWFGFDDALYSAARLIEILSTDTKTSAEVFGLLPDSINTPELNVDMAEGENFKFIEVLISKADFSDGKINNIDGIRVDFPDGWGLVRASNTTPSLVIRFEADTNQALKNIQDQFRLQMMKVKPDIALPF